MRATTMHLTLAVLATMSTTAHAESLAPLPPARTAGSPPAYNLEPSRGGIHPGKLDEWARRRRRRTKGRRRSR